MLQKNGKSVAGTLGDRNTCMYDVLGVSSMVTMMIVTSWHVYNVAI